MFYVGDILWMEQSDNGHCPEDFTGQVRDCHGGFWWFKNGVLHRDTDPETGITGPARIWVDKTQVWYKNGLLHREDGPSYVYEDGSAGSWWFEGRSYYTDDGLSKPENFPV